MAQKTKRNERRGVEMAKKGFIAEFKEFIARGNVMDLAVGVIIGGAFQSIVNSLVISACHEDALETIDGKEEWGRQHFCGGLGK